jgi:hypothetical protein
MQLLSWVGRGTRRLERDWDFVTCVFISTWYIVPGNLAGSDANGSRRRFGAFPAESESAPKASTPLVSTASPRQSPQSGWAERPRAQMNGGLLQIRPQPHKLRTCCYEAHQRGTLYLKVAYAYILQ